VDRSGQLHFLQVAQEGSEKPVLQYMVWDGQKWSPRDSLPLRSEHVTDIVGLSADVDPGGRLFAVYADLGPEEVDGTRHYELEFAAIAVDIPRTNGTATGTPEEATPMVAPSAVATQAIPATPTLALSATATPTVSPASAGLAEDAQPRDNSSLGLVVGTLSALALVTAILVIRLRFSRGSQS
jgi:hypothetical protein